MSRLSSIKIGSANPPQIMGIVNATPDSFSDGGENADEVVLQSKLRQWTNNAVDYIDIGAESTRPGAKEVPVLEQLRRLRQVWNLVAESAVDVSIDTRHAEVATWAVAHGATIINDVSGGTFDPSILEVAAENNTTFVVMHSQGLPQTMQKSPTYDDVLHEVCQELHKRVRAARTAGVNKIIVDPGIGFGKTLAHNLHILRGLQEIKRQLALPLLVGFSRKRMFAELVDGISDAERDTATAMMHALLIESADIVRVHNVRNIAMLRTLYAAVNGRSLHADSG